MFFYIGDDCPIKALKQVEHRLFLDEGWNEYLGIWYKGYSTDCVLSESLVSIVDGYKPAGKWCVIYKGQIYHPALRGFPIYNKDDILTNLKFDDFDPVVYEEVTYTRGSNISIEEASIMIGDLLVENAENFLRYNNNPHVHVVVSAGLDSTSCWTALDQVTKDYSLNAYLPKGTEKNVLEWVGCEREYTSDLTEKVGKDYWGYYHIPHRKDVYWSMGGYYGEVLHYRDAVAISAIANYHDKFIDELATEDDYLYWFLKRPGLDEFKKEKMKFDNEEHLKRYLYSTVHYDCQMWHLDNNMYFSPLFDIRIPLIMARLSVDDLTKNCVTGTIQRNIINRFRPDLLSILSPYKNEKDVWGNFRKHFPFIKHDPKIKLNIR